MTAYSSGLTESLVTLDAFSAVMPNWLAIVTEAVTTDDTLAHQYTAERILIDATGASTLGVVNLPFLFTYLPFGLGMDVTLRQTNLDRQDAETLSLSDSLNSRKTFLFAFTESLNLSEQPVIQQMLKRRLTDNIPYNGDAVIKHLYTYRVLTDQVGNDLLTSPMLTFPVPQNDILARHVGHTRFTPDTLYSNQSVVWQSGFSRTYVESHTTNDVVLRILGLGRHLTDAHSSNDVSTRHVVGNRTLSESLVVADSLLRHLILSRALSQALTVSDGMRAWHWIPRSTFETLTTSDAITTEQLLGMIMGYIWVDESGNVLAQLPDWNYTLTPGSPDVVNVAPVTSWTPDPTREK